VRWWVRTVPQARLVAVKAWPRPAFERRDVRLHRLFVVAYSRQGHAAASDQLGISSSPRSATVTKHRGGSSRRPSSH